MQRDVVDAVEPFVVAVEIALVLEREVFVQRFHVPDGEIPVGLHENIPESAGLRAHEIAVRFKFVEGFAAFHVERFGVAFTVGDVHRAAAGDLRALDKGHQLPAEIVKHAVVYLPHLHRLHRGGFQPEIRRGEPSGR